MVRKMLKISGILVLGFVLYSIIKPLTSDGIKSYYCLSDNRCVTVWKRENGEVYVIFGKYEDNNEPNTSYIKTINKQYLTLYFSTELSHKIIVRDEGNLESSQKMYEIKNNFNDKWEFLEYSDDYKPILYKSNAVKFKDVKASTDYLIINIEENYATDKTGKKVK